MKAQELRIRNLVECFETREVVAIKKNKIKVQHESKKGHFIIEWVPIDSLSLKPIPITEEWLLKFGFESNPYQDRYEKRDIHIECIKTSGTTKLWIEKMAHIKYFHQLQNLYFALSGEELTIKEN
jgi:hypothetical protein